jgi:hypothetical protein
MRTRFDQFGKQMVRAALEIHGAVETDAEVPAEARRIDLWFTPDEARARIPDHLGWLGRMTGGPSTLEFFHHSPSGNELTECLIKHGEFRHFLSGRAFARPLPTQWVISSGRPDGGIEGLGFHPIPGWPSGIYEGPPLLWTRLVVVNELPVTRDTLLLRLLGAGSVLKRATAELQALAADAPERALALPILLRLRLTVPSDPAEQTCDDQEFLMNTQDIVETWRQEAVMQGERKLLMRQLRRRFGAQVDGDTERRVAAASVEQIEVWAERVLSAATLAELLAD